MENSLKEWKRSSFFTISRVIYTRKLSTGWEYCIDRRIEFTGSGFSSKKEALAAAKKRIKNYFFG